MRLLSRVWPRRDEHPDIRQEAYARVYEAARKARPVAPKAFLFATARHLMADRVRRERIVSIQAGGENEYLNVLIDEISPEQMRMRLHGWGRSVGPRGHINVKRGDGLRICLLCNNW
jgi:DNA-directed RNA polymerase specialized sigma24 family protein